MELNKISRRCDGTDFIKTFCNGCMKKGDSILMFSIDGMQLYHSKLSDCWISIWVIFNFDPKTGCYKKTSILYSCNIPGPNKPKNLESFLFLGLHHLSALQQEGLSIWDAFMDILYISPSEKILHLDKVLQTYIICVFSKIFTILLNQQVRPLKPR